MSPTRVAVLLCGFLSLTTLGCGGGDQMQTAPVTGTVTWNGKPVTEGELQFVPQVSDPKNPPGKPGSATIQPDGTYSVSTYGDKDGAVVGKHTITYVAPPARSAQESASQSSGEPSNQGPAVASPFAGLVPKQTAVEIKPNGGALPIELVKP